MNNAVKKPKNPVALLLEKDAPGWLDWFRGFREKRNDIKSGVGFAVTDLGEEGIGLIFHTFTPKGGMVIDLVAQSVVTFRDIVESMERLAELTALLTDDDAATV
jgi:hypothetical protein